MCGIAKMPSAPPDLLTRFDSPFRAQQFGFGSYLLNGAQLGVRALAVRMPAARRDALGRGLGRGFVALHQGYRRRIADNLARVFPELTARERAALAGQAAAQMGAALLEHMDMARLVAEVPVAVEGEAHLPPAGGALFVSGHLGQWEAIRIALLRREMRCGFFYRPQNNGFYDRHWRADLAAAGTPVIPKGGPGKEIMATHLRAGGRLLMLSDQAIRGAPRLDFMGHPAHTGLTAAQMALDYGLPLIPAFGLRDADGLRAVFGAPIPHAMPEAMMQAANDALAAQIRAHPAQYMWSHRRWRLFRQK